MSNVQTVIDTIQMKREQQRFDLEVLALWTHLEKETEYTHEDVRAFTYCPAFHTKEEKAEQRRCQRARVAPKYCDKNWHNAVRLRTGDLVPMPGFKRPTPPEHSFATITKVTESL